MPVFSLSNTYFDLKTTIYGNLQCWSVRVPHKTGGVLYAVTPDAPGVIEAYALVHDPVALAGCCNTTLKKSSLT